MSPDLKTSASSEVKMFVIFKGTTDVREEVAHLKITAVGGKLAKNGHTFTTACRRETNYRSRLTVWTANHHPSAFEGFCFEKEEQARAVLMAHLSSQIASAREIVESFTSQLNALVKETEERLQSQEA